MASWWKGSGSSGKLFIIFLSRVHPGGSAAAAWTSYFPLHFTQHPSTDPCLWGLGIPPQGQVQPLHLILFPLVPPGLAPSTPITLWCLQSLPAYPPSGNMLKLFSTSKAPSFDLVFPLSFPCTLSLVNELTSLGGSPPPLIPPLLCTLLLRLFPEVPSEFQMIKPTGYMSFLIFLDCFVDSIR